MFSFSRLILQLVVLAFVSMEYVGISWFSSDSDCISAEYVDVQWIVPTPSICSEYYLDMYEYSEYILDEDQLRVVHFNDSSCQWVKTEIIIPIGKCKLYPGKMWYTNVSVFQSLPFDAYSGTNEWLVLERYEDEVCDSFFHGSVDFQMLSIGIYSPIEGFFCSGNQIVISIVTVNAALESQMYFEVLPRRAFTENKCFTNNNGIFTWLFEQFVINTFSDEVFLFQSLGVKCLAFADLKETYVDSGRIPSNSSHRYFFGHYSYDSNCFESKIDYSIRLNLCYRDGLAPGLPGKHIIVNDRKMAMVSYGSYEAHNCSGDPIHYELNSYSYLNDDDREERKEDNMENKIIYDCHLRGKRFDFLEYESYTIGNDPYFPSQLGVVVSEVACDVPFVGFMKYPDFIVFYQDRSVCNPNSFASSMRGYCEDGIAKVYVYGSSRKCLGPSTYLEYAYYDVPPSDLCVSTGTHGVNVRAVCIPRYCGNYSELQTDNVCNGRGECVQYDLCACSIGYEGNLCQTWSCFGIEKTFTDLVCGGHGVCKSPDSCVCNEEYSGEFCDQNVVSYYEKGISKSWRTLGIVFGSVGPPLVLLVCIFCVCFVCFFCFCLFTITFFSVALGGVGGIILFSQKRRLSEFEKLDDFPILLKEQMLEKDNSVAKIKINKKLFEIQFNEIEVQKLIGKGGSEAVVFLAVWKGNRVAFKCFKTTSLLTSQDKFNQFESEVNLLANIHHPNIISFFGATLRPPRVGIVMEYCSNGEILNFCMKFREENGKGYPLNEKIRLLVGIISAVEYIHSREIIHRDIKSENILIDSSESPKLMDFGISRIIDPQDETKTRRVGTNIYMCPEMVLTGSYDEKVDSFSFAILMWVIFSENSKPYGGKDARLFNIELRVANDPNLRPDLEEIEFESVEYEWMKEVMKRCWHEDPSERYSFPELSEVFQKHKKALENIVFIGRVRSLLFSLRTFSNCVRLMRCKGLLRGKPSSKSTSPRTKRWYGEPNSQRRFKRNSHKSFRRGLRNSILENCVKHGRCMNFFRDFGDEILPDKIGVWYC